MLAETICLILGMGQLTPFNCLLNSYGFWMEKLSGNTTLYLETRTLDSDDPEKWVYNSYQNFWTSFLALMMQIGSLIFIILNVKFLSKSKKITRTRKIYISLFTMLFCLICFTIFTQIEVTNSWILLFFILTLLLVFLCSGAGLGIYLGEILTIGGLLQGQYIGYMMTGQSVIGIVISLIEILLSVVFKMEAEAIYGDSYQAIDQTMVGLVFFIVGAVIIAMNILGFFQLMRFGFVSDILSENSKQDQENFQRAGTLSPYWPVIKKSRYQFLSLFFTFTITFTFYPFVPQRAASQCIEDDSTSTTSYCQFINDTVGSEMYTLVFCFLLYNLSDFVGRYLGNKAQVGLTNPKNYKILLGCSISRIVLGLLFFLIRRDNFSGWSFFSYDISFFLLMIIFSVSSGFMITQSISSIYVVVDDEKDRDRVGTLLALVIAVSGIAAACLSYGTVAVIA